MHVRNRILAAAIALAWPCATVPASAQSYYPEGGSVATLSVVSGYVTIVRADSGQQFAGTINAPLMAGDYIATGAASHAVCQFDGVTTLRIAPNTQVRLVNLNPGARAVQLAAGTTSLAEYAYGAAEIDTPSIAMRPNQRGVYRVSVFSNGETLVAVRSGVATVSYGSGSQTVGPDTTLVATGPYSSPAIALQGPLGSDSFDQFDAQQDQYATNAYNANPYLAPQLAGYTNFASYGQWQNVPGYGYAWAPNNQSNFAPYQNGQWTWEPGYGYTWVPSEPWGYVPAHYGSWFYNNNYGGWLWQPPAYQTQTTAVSLASTWLPALVAFFLIGANGNSGNPYGSGNIGWVPLAPGERYQPWYGQNGSYPATTITNVTNVTNIYNYYGNMRYPRAVRMVPIGSWRNGNFSHPTTVQPQQLQHIQLIRGAIPVVPTAANLAYTHAAPARKVTLSRTFAVSPRFAARAPAITHATFAAEQAKIKTIAGVKPKVVSLPALTAVTHPVYHPVSHPSIVPLVIAKPAHAAPVHTAPPVRRIATPRPIIHTPTPFVRHVTTPRPAIHTAPPVRRIATPRPIVHTPTPFVRHVTTPRPAIHTAPPARHIATPPPHMPARAGSATPKPKATPTG
jgi:hypothetical protein